MGMTHFKLILFILYYFNDLVQSSLLSFLQLACMDLHLHDNTVTKAISILIRSVSRLLFSIGVAFFANPYEVWEGS